ncbi:cobyrinate a,c-diamide synthase [Paenibacillus gansuensis]|uniref:Cobyrinate a,c-diamide synthase n=1 Tax=Paenibacillus gansuensis TaxID=306542 RepID=A0ABW5PLH5_9BACL
MQTKRILIAGTGSGAGKTTVTIGLMAAYQRLGYTVQGFKCGPDYIDPTYHSAVTGRSSRNLDSWMCQPHTVKEIFKNAIQDADVAIIEGVMGLFDGKSPQNNEGSSAEIALITETPVLLVVDCEGVARSAAAIVKGFQHFHPELQIAGVIANRVGGAGHYGLIKTAIEQECGIPALGYLERDGTLLMPERHLGLIPSIERGELAPFFQLLADTISNTFDLQGIENVMAVNPIEIQHLLFPGPSAKRKVTIAVAKDEAFSFYYPENLELLEQYGAEIVYFSPLRGELVPDDIEGLYIGGGFPEEYAAALSQQEAVHESVRKAISSGVLTFGECGGFMYLTGEIIALNGERYPMAGVIPGRVRMQDKLSGFGYRYISGRDRNFLLGPADQAKGHEYHYSTFEPDGEWRPAYETKGFLDPQLEGYLSSNVVAGYTHIHFASHPELADRWVKACERLKLDRSIYKQ